MKKPKLVINTDIPINRLQAKSIEEQCFLDLIGEIGEQNAIDLAMNIEPGRDFTEDPLKTAKDVICTLYANGGQQSVLGLTYTDIVPPQAVSPEDRIAVDY